MSKGLSAEKLAALLVLLWDDGPCETPHQKTAGLRLCLGPVGSKCRKEISVKLILDNTQKAQASITLDPPDSRLDGKPEWTNTNPACGHLEVADDGMSAFYVSTDGAPVGTLDTVAIKGDADLGEGVQTIEADFDVEITSPQATGFGISFGSPQPK